MISARSRSSSELKWFSSFPAVAASALFRTSFHDSAFHGCVVFQSTGNLHEMGFPTARVSAAAVERAAAGSTGLHASLLVASSAALIGFILESFGACNLGRRITENDSNVDVFNDFNEVSKILKNTKVRRSTSDTIDNGNDDID